MGNIRNTYIILNKVLEGMKRAERQTHLVGKNQTILNAKVLGCGLD
jgi:hypothetical protein